MYVDTKWKRMWKNENSHWLCKVDGDFLFLISITATTLLLVSF